MDTVPLLTPTMETELLKESWIFPQTKANTIKEEEETASSTWEENFQDLSGWCMDMFQGQYDFHIGESPTFKLSGTKYEGTSVLSSEEGGVIELPSVEDEKWSTRMNIAESPEHLNSVCRNLQCVSKITGKHQKEDAISQSSTSNSLKISKTTPAVNTTSWSKRSNAGANTSLQPRYQVEEVDLEDTGPTSVDTAEGQRDSWDILYSVANNGSETFDLLSYLCDDEMRSPEDSVSTVSSVQSKPPWSPTESRVTSPPQTNAEVKTKIETATQKRPQRRATSTITSSSTETPTVVSSRKLKEAKTFVSNKVEKTSYNKLVKRGRPAKRRYVDSDLEDETYTLHYRESREKNNEASRKSRMNKKAKESEMTMKAVELEKDNRILKMKVQELEKLVTSMRSALLRSALKKEV